MSLQRVTLAFVLASALPARAQDVPEAFRLEMEVSLEARDELATGQTVWQDSEASLRLAIEVRGYADGGEGGRASIRIAGGEGRMVVRAEGAEREEPIALEAGPDVPVRWGPDGQLEIDAERAGEPVPEGLGVLRRLDLSDLAGRALFEGHPLEVGESWEVAPPCPEGAGTTRVEVASLEEGIAIVRIEGTTRRAADLPAGKSPGRVELETTRTAVWRVDRASRLPLERREEVRTVVRGSSGETAWTRTTTEVSTTRLAPMGG